VGATWGGYPNKGVGQVTINNLLKVQIDPSSESAAAIRRAHFIPFTPHPQCGAQPAQFAWMATVAASAAPSVIASKHHTASACSAHGGCAIAAALPAASAEEDTVDVSLLQQHHKGGVQPGATSSAGIALQEPQANVSSEVDAANASPVVLAAAGSVERRGWSAANLSGTCDKIIGTCAWQKCHIEKMATCNAKKQCVCGNGFCNSGKNGRDGVCVRDRGFAVDEVQEQVSTIAEALPEV